MLSFLRCVTGAINARCFGYTTRLSGSPHASGNPTHRCRETASPRGIGAQPNPSGMKGSDSDTPLARGRLRCADVSEAGASRARFSTAILECSSRRFLGPCLAVHNSEGSYQEVGTDRSTFAVISLWGKFGGPHACGGTLPHMVPLPNIFLTLFFSDQRLKRKDFPEVARPPWAHRTRLQRLLLLILTANVSNKSGNLLFAQSYPEQYENVGFVHSWCTVESHQKSYRVNPSLRQRCALQRPSKGIALLDARINLRRTSSSPPLMFSGILVGILFRSLRANDSLAPSVADTRCSTLQ